MWAYGQWRRPDPRAETTADGRVVECSTPQLLGLDGSKGDGANRIYYLKFAAYKSASWTSLKLPASL